MTPVTVSVHLSSEEQMAYDSWRGVINAWGWTLDGTESRVQGQLLLALPAVQGRTLTAADFKAYLQQLLSTGGKAEIPHCVQTILASLA